MNRLGRILAICLLMAGAGGGMPDIGFSEPSKEIRVITPQWEDQTNPDGTGLFFDIVKAVYGPAGVKMHFRFAPWKRCQASVRAGKHHAMLCVWEAHARQEGQLIPKYPLFVEHTAVIFKRASMIQWGCIHDLDCLRAVWLRGYDYHVSGPLKQIQFATWHEVDSHEKAWRQLNSDRFDVYIEALIDLDNYIRKHGVDMDLYQKEILWSQKAYIAFSDTPASRDLIRIYDQKMPELVRSGRLARIYERWHQAFYPAFWQD